MQEDRTTLQVYRALCALTPALVLGVGLLQSESETPATWAIRGLLALTTAALLLLSFGKERQRKRFVAWVRGYLWVLPLWPTANIVMQAGEPRYVVSGALLSAFFSLAYSLGLTRSGPLKGYLAWVFALYYGVATLFAPEDVLPYSMVVELGLVMVMIYLATVGRLRHAGSLARREALARQAQRVAGLGVFEWDVRSNEVRWNEPLYHLLGYDPETVEPSQQALRARVHPDDAQTVHAYERAMYKGLPSQPFTARIIPANAPPGAEPRWITADFSVGRNEAGRLLWAIGTMVDITDRQRREAALRQAAEEAQAARREAEEHSRLKSAFLANLSHEIRTPLTAILGFVRILDDETEGRHGPILESMERSGMRLLNTLQSLLDLAQVEAGLVMPEQVPVPLDALALETGLEFSEEALARGLELDIQDAPPESLLAVGDAKAVQQILRHLLDNALKFTERGGVALHFGRERGEAWVCIEDTGRGITPEALEHAFEPFRQGSEGIGRQHEGVGLGLTLSLRLAEAMGGRLEIARRDEGGTAARLVLQEARVEVPEARPGQLKLEAD